MLDPAPTSHIRYLIWEIQRFLVLLLLLLLLLCAVVLLVSLKYLSVSLILLLLYF
jgi:hypothetical protein